MSAAKKSQKLPKQRGGWKRIIQVPDWEKLQEDRSGSQGGSKRILPWSKLYHGFVLGDPAFRSLTKAQRADWLDMHALARKTGNEIPDDPSYLMFETRATSPIDVQPLIDAGFLIRRTIRTTSGLDVDVDKERERDLDSRGEGREERPSKKREKQSPKKGIQFPLKGAAPWDMTDEIISEFAKRYPALDVPTEIRRLIERMRKSGVSLPDGNSVFNYIDRELEIATL